MSAFISPVRASSRVPPMADGRPATIPEKMMIEMPLPTPRSVTCSPSHIRNTVPVTSVTIAVSTKPGPGLMTRALPAIDWPCRALEMPKACMVARPTVP